MLNHPEVDYFPVTESPEVFYSSYATAIFQQLLLIIFLHVKETSYFLSRNLTVTFNVVAHPKEITSCHHLRYSNELVNCRFFSQASLCFEVNKTKIVKMNCLSPYQQLAF